MVDLDKLRSAPGRLRSTLVRTKVGSRSDPRRIGSDQVGSRKVPNPFFFGILRLETYLVERDQAVRMFLHPLFAAVLLGRGALADWPAETGFIERRRLPERKSHAGLVFLAGTPTVAFRHVFECPLYCVRVSTVADAIISFQRFFDVHGRFFYY